MTAEERCFMEKLRLDRFIANQTGMPRSEVKKMIYWGKVTLNGKAVHSCDLKIIPDNDTVTLKGETIQYKKFIYVMLNKPKGYVCSTKDGISPTVISLLPPELQKKNLFPAGRLDKDTTGFVFLTNDGELTHRILSPKKHIAKYYFVKLAQPYSQDYQDRFLNGIIIDGGEKCLPAKVCGIPNRPEYALLELFEGKFHQVKRMFSAVGNSVTELSRVQMGNLPMSRNIGLGEHLEIMHNDVENLLISSSFEDVHRKICSDFWSYLINNNL